MQWAETRRSLQVGFCRSCKLFNKNLSQAAAAAAKSSAPRPPRSILGAAGEVLNSPSADV